MPSRKFFAYRVLFAVLAAGVLQTAAATLTGRIVSISDGDTVTLLDANLQQHKIRLSGIDAPDMQVPSKKS
jgi:endonuclease YncB( thermonuclease family)